MTRRLLELIATVALFLIVWVVYPPPANAQVGVVFIRDTIRNPDSTLFNGTVTITWTGPYDGFQRDTQSRVSNGVFSSLVVSSPLPNQTYRVQYASTDGANVWSEAWSVPYSSAPLTISQVKQSGAVKTLAISVNGITFQAIVGAASPVAQNVGISNTGAGTLAWTASKTQTWLTLATTSGTAPSALALIPNSGSLSAGTYIDTVTINGTGAASSPQTVTVTLNVSASSSSGSIMFIDSETPTGSVNGTNVVFAIANVPSPASSLKVMRNGIRLRLGGDYTFTGQTITLGTAPQSGDVLLVDYRQ